MKILANENFPKTSITYLRSVGYDILAISEEYGGIKDEDVIQIAIKEEELL